VRQRQELVQERVRDEEGSLREARLRPAHVQVLERVQLQRVRPDLPAQLRPGLRHGRQDLPEQLLHGAGELQGQVARRSRQKTLRQMWRAGKTSQELSVQEIVRMLRRFFSR